MKAILIIFILVVMYLLLIISIMIVENSNAQLPQEAIILSAPIELSADQSGISLNSVSPKIPEFMVA